MYISIFAYYYHSETPLQSATGISAYYKQDQLYNDHYDAWNRNERSFSKNHMLAFTAMHPHFHAK